LYGDTRTGELKYPFIVRFNFAPFAYFSEGRVNTLFYFGAGIFNFSLGDKAKAREQFDLVLKSLLNTHYRSLANSYLTRLQEK